MTQARADLRYRRKLRAELHSQLARELRKPDRWMPDITDESTRRIAQLFAPPNRQSERRSVPMGQRG